MNKASLKVPLPSFSRIADVFAVLISSNCQSQGQSLTIRASQHLFPMLRHDKRNEVCVLLQNVVQEFPE